jgi:hypothetical protein
MRFLPVACFLFALAVAALAVDVEIGSTSSSSTGSWSSGTYDNSMNTAWSFPTNEYYYLRLTFLSFEFESYDHCEVCVGSPSSKRASFSGSASESDSSAPELNTPYCTDVRSDDTWYMRIDSDSSVTYSGVVISYQLSYTECGDDDLTLPRFPTSYLWVACAAAIILVPLLLITAAGHTHDLYLRMKTKRNMA